LTVENWKKAFYRSSYTCPDISAPAHDKLNFSRLGFIKFTARKKFRQPLKTSNFLPMTTKVEVLKTKASAAAKHENSTCLLEFISFKV